MHNYDAIRNVDPWYVNSVLLSLHGDLVQVDRNICSKLSYLWELHTHSNPVSHSSQSRPSGRSLSERARVAEEMARSKVKAEFAQHKAELFQKIDRLQRLSEGMLLFVNKLLPAYWGSPFLLLYGGSPPASLTSHLAGLLRRRDPSTNPGPTAWCVSVGN